MKTADLNTEHASSDTAPPQLPLHSDAFSAVGRIVAFGIDEERPGGSFYVELATPNGRARYLADEQLPPLFRHGQLDIGNTVEVALGADGKIATIDRTTPPSQGVDQNAPEPIEPPAAAGTKATESPGLLPPTHTPPGQNGVAASESAVPQPLPVALETAKEGPSSTEVRRQRRVAADASAVAAFIEENIANDAWRVESNVRRAGPALKAILASTPRMKTLAPYVDEKLGHLDPLHVLETHAAIASTLQRADYNDLAIAVATARKPLDASFVLPALTAEIASLPRPRTPRAASLPDRPEHVILGAAGADAPQPAPHLQLTRNGFIPQSDAGFDRSAVKKKLLEEMRYQVRSDGTVLYQLAGANAFIDQGDQLLMVSGADQQERPILGALLLAKEKYAGAFELTGDEAFKRTALSIIVKYQLDVRLTNPEQDALMREMAAAPKAPTVARATAANPAKPLDLVAPLVTPTSQLGDTALPHSPIIHPGAAAQSATISTGGHVDEEVLNGEIIRLGRAPYLHIPDNKTSYFIELQTKEGARHVAWGLGLDPIRIGVDLRRGDNIELRRPRVGTNREWLFGAGPTANTAETSPAIALAESPAPADGVSTSQAVDAQVDHGKKKVPNTVSENNVLEIPAFDGKAAAVQPTDHRAGKVQLHGRARYHFDAFEPFNYFVTLRNADGRESTIWGKELEGALAEAGVEIGDEIALKRAGRTPVTVQRNDRDDLGKVIDFSVVETHRNAWEVAVLKKAEDSEAEGDTAVSDHDLDQSKTTNGQANRLEGILLRHGTAPHKNTSRGKPSYFAELKNSDGRMHTAWGVDLARAIADSGARLGEHVVLRNLGKRAVQVDRASPDGHRLRKGVSYRNEWEVQTTKPMSSESPAHEPDAQDATCVVEMRPALWWERQLAFIQHYVADSPQLLKQIERLGPKSNPEHVVRIDQSGRTEASKAPLGSKDWRESAHPPKPSAMPPFITGGAPEGRGHRPPFALTRGGDQYLQGVARIEGAIKHIIVLLHSPPGEQSAAVLPVLAATSTESGMAWRPIGFGMALPNRDGRGRDEVLRFEIGRMIIDAKVALPPGDALRGQLGLPIHAGHRQEPGPENRARAKVIAGRAHESASRASS